MAALIWFTVQASAPCSTLEILNLKQTTITETVKCSRSTFDSLREVRQYYSPWKTSEQIKFLQGIRPAEDVNLTTYRHHPKLKLCGLFVPHIMPCLIRWRTHCAAADSLTMATCEAVSAGRCVLPRKTGLLHPLGSYQKDGNGTMTSVRNIWSALKCDYAAVIISQPLSQVSPNNFRTTLVPTHPLYVYITPLQTTYLPWHMPLIEWKRKYA
jgi:hypothetical protein